MKMCLHGSKDSAKKSKLRFWMGDPDLPESGKRYTTCRVEKEVEAQRCTFGKTTGSRAHVALAAECEL